MRAIYKGREKNSLHLMAEVLMADEIDIANDEVHKHQEQE